MRSVDENTEPYQVLLSSGVRRQMVPLTPEVCHRIHTKLGQLAELSALTLGYVQSLPQRAVLNAEEQGFSIRYEIDDANRTLTAIEIVGRQAESGG